MEDKALITVEKLDIAVVFSDKGMAKLLDEIKTKVIAHVPDITTEQGRKDIISLAYKITRSKTLIDDLGRGVVSDWKKKAKLIDEHRKTARDFLDDLKNTTRQPLTEWEAEQAIIKAEEDRKEQERIEARIAALALVNKHLPFFEVAGWTDDEFDQVFLGADNEYRTEQRRLADEEANRKAEAAKLIIERTEIDRVRQEQAEQARLQAEKEKALQAERDAINAEKWAEVERKDREAFEKEAIKQAHIQSEVEAKARIEREAREKKEKEEEEAAEKIRLVELAPDKEKLLIFADKLFKSKNDLIPEFKFGSPAYPILADCEIKIDRAIKKLIQETEAL